MLSSDSPASEVPPFTCPYCETELQLLDGAWYYTCVQCGKHLDLKSQFAYLRGLDAFSEGQALMDGISPRKRRVPTYPKVSEAVLLFEEAYSSLQVAFQAELAEAQRSLGVEMMAAMAQEFLVWEKISFLEMTYWKSLAVEQTAQKEYDEIKQKLARPGGSPFSFLIKMRWRGRKKQLTEALVKLDARIKLVERQISFIDFPRARNHKWKPTD
jgi:hypothetical protein